MSRRRDIVGASAAVLVTEGIGALRALAAGRDFVQHLTWVSFATYLNAGIWRLN